ncbi:DUF4118 domain-containing protein [Rhodococcus sp. NPDC059968]|uniref:sensor histidine kinase n=1 Tax=Rhodococcus sp. NPDC059968 TaxID=3347017 RepID=UPI00367301F3
MRARLLSWLMRPAAPRLALGLAVAASFIAAESLLVVLLEQIAPNEAFGVVYLLGVLVVSMVWGLGLAVVMSVASAIAFDYFRNWPEGFLAAGAQNWVAIAVFLVVALSANTLAGVARSHADQLRALAEQQAALRRVATLVARVATSSEVFTAVTEELARVLGVFNTALFRFEPDDVSTLLASRTEPGVQQTPVGTRHPVEGENVVAMVSRTGRAARMDSHDNAAGVAAAYIRKLGVRSGVGAPIVVDGRLWGAATAGSTRREPLPPDTEARIADFADLVATAIANAETRAQLTASRARIVAAADEARRRLERDLHDGAQQRLVSLGLALRTVQASVPSAQAGVKEQISDVVQGLVGVSADLQEISRGIHPAIRSKGGLGPALEALARRSAVPVDLDVDLDLDARVPESTEVAAYYVVAESLTNAAKHARASEVNVRVRTDGGNLELSIRDDGVGGADPAKGSGLTGLRDRVEALGGQIEIASHAGNGTSLLVTIPFADE